MCFRDKTVLSRTCSPAFQRTVGRTYVSHEGRRPTLNLRVRAVRRLCSLPKSFNPPRIARTDLPLLRDLCTSTVRRLKGDETPLSFLALSRHIGRTSTCREGRAKKFLPRLCASLAYFSDTTKRVCNMRNKIKIIFSNYACNYYCNLFVKNEQMSFY